MPYCNTDKQHNMTSKQITVERAIEAINICSEFMTENMIAYQSTLFPQCVRITGTSIISSLELEPLTNAGFYYQITISLIDNWAIEISIYDRK